jgi:hypothetical protein
MTERRPIDAKNLDGYGAEILQWDEVRNALAGQHPAETPFFLSTLSPAGQIHTAGIGPSWFEGDFYIVTGLGTRKGKDLVAKPECTLATRLQGFDVTLSGKATIVRDSATLEAVSAVFREGGWPAEVEGDAFTAPYSAPSAGPPPWHLFRFTFTDVVALGTTESGGATKWRFAS